MSLSPENNKKSHPGHGSIMGHEHLTKIGVNAIVTVIVTDFLALVFVDTQ